ncbi:MAG: sigma-54-dependent Fis family transcriptional regulator [Acidobacteriaceae bacterium]|jgi:DNA-binding NtrC family response regulator|nr:sigma-54-dependent Fis family transcriptional regulator [Acidobacteriaceae bacterium]
MENASSRLLVVEDDSSVRSNIVTCLELEGFAVDAVGSTREALTRLAQEEYPIVLSDIYLDERTGLDVLRAARESNPTCAVILMSGRGSMETVMAATRGGAFDYLAKPFDLDDMIEKIRRAEASLREAGEKQARIDDIPETDMIGSSAGMVAIYKTLAQVAPTEATVLIEGETGTGKELIARMIHRHSRRADKPFVPVDCGSIPPSLLESELFGALKGSFTGADRDRTGVFEAAHTGTVFLDEIGDIDLNFQAKLLRVLQEKEIRPLGASRAKSIDVRVVAATNKNVRQLVEDGKFREDLWFRLDVVKVELPPLRERTGDIPLLVQKFMDRYNERYAREAVVTKSGLNALDSYTWPGNVRQLQHMMERLVILAPQGRIDEAAVRDAIADAEGRDTPAETLEDAKAEQIKKVLAAANGNKSKAAKILGIERKTLYRLIDRFGL